MSLPLIHFYCYLVLLLLYVTTATIGYLIAGQTAATHERPYLTGVLYSLLGCLTLVAVVAVWRCGGVTYQLSLLAVPIVVGYSHFTDRRSDKLSIRNCVTAIFISQPISYALLSIIYVIVALMFLPFSNHWLQINNLDFGYYAYQSRNVFQSGLEGVLWGMNVLTPTTRSLYHFTDAWLCGIVSASTGLLHYHVYILVVKTFATSLIAIAVFDVMPLRSVIEKAIASLTVIFVGTSLFFINVDAASYRWVVEFYPSIINYHGGLFAVMYVSIIAILILNRQTHLLGYLLLSVGGGIHTMLLPVAVAFFPARALCEIIWYEWYHKRFNTAAFKHYIFFFLIAVGSAWWSFSITQSNTVSALGFNPSTVFKTAIFGLLRSWFEVTVLCGLSFAGLTYLAIKKWKQDWEWVIDYLLLTAISIGIYSILFDSEQGNSWQIKIVVITPLLFVLGYVGLTYFILDWRTVLRYVVLVFFAVVFVVLSCVQPNYFFGPGPINKWNDKRTLRIDQAQISRITAVTDGKGPGGCDFKR